MSKLFFKTLTGSRLHNLHTEESDWGWKEVVISPLEQIISPFKNDSGSSTKEGTNDICTYELRHFVKLLAQSNPTVLEVLASQHVKTPPGSFFEFYTVLYENTFVLLHPEKVYYAHRGYAKDQRTLFTNPNASLERISKASVAYIRIMHQGIDLLKTGTFDPVIRDPILKEELLLLKYNFDITKHPQIVMERMEKLELQLTEAYETTCLAGRTPDIPWAENFLKEVYTKLS